jgi:hypothetical protein
VAHRQLRSGLRLHGLAGRSRDSDGTRGGVRVGDGSSTCATTSSSRPEWPATTPTTSRSRRRSLAARARSGRSRGKVIDLIPLREPPSRSDTGDNARSPASPRA